LIKHLQTHSTRTPSSQPHKTTLPTQLEGRYNHQAKFYKKKEPIQTKNKPKNKRDKKRWRWAAK